MTHPLDGARLKIIRAQEHVDALKAAIRTYLDERPYEILTQQNADETFSTTVSTRIAPPLRLSTIIGNCLTDARAALDYIAWELADRYVPAITQDPRRRRQIAFPLRGLVDPPDPGYVNHINRLQKLVRVGYPAAALEAIQAVQPNQAGYVPLWWLHELVNVDKHRMPVLTIGALDTFRATFGHSKVRFGRHPGKVFFEETVIAGDFSVEARDLTTERLTLDSDAMQVDAQATIYVAFQDVSMPRAPVDRTLEQMIECVANVVPRFDPFFV